MNSDSDFHSLSRDEQEARLTALILGELEPAEATAVGQAVAADPELARLQAQLEATVGLLRQAAAQPVVPAGEAAEWPKMAPEKREAVLRRLRGAEAEAVAEPSAGPEARVIPVDFVDVGGPGSGRSANVWLLAAACGVVLLGVWSLAPGSLESRFAKSLVRYDVAPEPVGRQNANQWYFRNGSVSGGATAAGGAVPPPVSDDLGTSVANGVIESKPGVAVASDRRSADKASSNRGLQRLSEAEAPQLLTLEKSGPADAPVGADGRQLGLRARYGLMPSKPTAASGPETAATRPAQEMMKREESPATVAAEVPSWGVAKAPMTGPSAPTSLSMVVADSEAAPVAAAATDAFLISAAPTPASAVAAGQKPASMDLSNGTDSTRESRGGERVLHESLGEIAQQVNGPASAPPPGGTTATRSFSTSFEADYSDDFREKGAAADNGRLSRLSSFGDSTRSRSAGAARQVRGLASEPADAKKRNFFGRTGGEDYGVIAAESKFGSFQSVTDADAPVTWDRNAKTAEVQFNAPAESGAGPGAGGLGGGLGAGGFGGGGGGSGGRPAISATQDRSGGAKEAESRDQVEGVVRLNRTGLPGVELAGEMSGNGKSESKFAAENFGFAAIKDDGLAKVVEKDKASVEQALVAAFVPVTEELRAKQAPPTEPLTDGLTDLSRVEFGKPETQSLVRAAVLFDVKAADGEKAPEIQSNVDSLARSSERGAEAPSRFAGQAVKEFARDKVALGLATSDPSQSVSRPVETLPALAKAKTEVNSSVDSAKSDSGAAVAGKPITWSEESARKLSIVAGVAPVGATTAPVERFAKALAGEPVAAPVPAPAPVVVPVAQAEVSTAENAFSTFSLNVSDVSFKLAQASLEKGQMPAPNAVRVEEFLNAFQYHDPDPAGGAPIAFAWERARHPFAHDRDLLRLSVRTAAKGREAGRPLNLVLALDNSGSMERADRVRILREAIQVLAGKLGPADKVSVVSFARTARVWLDGMAGNRTNEMLEAVGNLRPEGGTNLEEALRVAYEAAFKNFAANGVNRVVLLTDGAANLGDVDPSTLKKTVEENRRRGVALDAFGIGWEGLNDDLLEELSRNGDGRYGFVNSPEEATTEFANQLAGALEVAASDVKVQVEFNPRRVTGWRQVGYAKHQLKKEQFRDNAVDAAELGAAESGNALYVLQTNPAGEGPIGTARVRFKVPGTGVYQEKEWVMPYQGAALPVTAAGPAMRLAVTASTFGEWLARSPYAAEADPGKLLGLVSGLPAMLQPDPRPTQLENMLRQAQSVGR